MIADRWEHKRLGSIFFENNKKNTDLESTEALQYYFGSIIHKHKYDLTPDLKATYMKYTMVEPGDIMINGLNLNYDFVTQRIAKVTEPGIITSAYICIRPRKEFSSDYYCYLLKSLDSKKFFNGMGSGIRQTLSFALLKNIELPVPPHSEQEQIVRFLDWKISGINRLINIKKKEIDNLKELRNSAIDDGILHGFHTGDMKASDIYWLGDIPSAWGVMPIKRVAKINASVADIVKVLDDEELITFLPMENVSERGEIDCSIKRPLKEVKSGYSSFAKGDVVVAKITPCFENGKGACLDTLDTEMGF